MEPLRVDLADRAFVPSGMGQFPASVIVVAAGALLSFLIRKAGGHHRAAFLAMD